MTDPTSVSFTVKELIADVKDTLSRIEGMLGNKADRAEVDRLSVKVEAHEIILQRADATKASAKATWAGALAIAGLVVSVVLRYVH